MLDQYDRKHEVRGLEDVFEKGISDIEWMHSVAAWSPKPAILCGDGRILRNKAELAALREADLTFVFLAPGWTRIPWSDFAWKIVKAWPAILESVKNASRATVFELRIQGKIQRSGLVRDLS